MGVVHRTLWWCVGLGGLLLISMLASAAIGPVRIHPYTVLLATLNLLQFPNGLNGTQYQLPLLGRSITLLVPSFEPAFAFEVRQSHQAIVGTVRLPRIVLAAVVGCSLAAAGTVMQGFFRNALADPSIIGVSTGAAAGAVAAIAFPLLVPVSLHVAAFVGAVGTAFLVYAIATEGGRTPVATLLLAGIAVQAFLGAAIAYMMLHSGEGIRAAVVWLMGHLHNSAWSDVAFAAPVVLLGVLVLGAYTREMNVLLLGEEDAHYLGIEVERTKLILLTVSSVIAAAGVAVAGVIGFVGLVVPHIMRLIVGPDHRILLPTSALAGASFLVATDTFARAGPAEVPVGIVTAALGAPFFLYLLKRREVYAL